MHTDPIADMLTRMRNAIKAHHNVANIPYSKLKESVLKVLKEKGFIEDYKVEQEKSFKSIKVTFKEDSRDLTLKKVSKPGQRVNSKSKDLKLIKSGLGITILSTSKGIMSNIEARKQNVGGEVICEIY